MKKLLEMLPDMQEELSEVKAEARRIAAAPEGSEYSALNRIIDTEFETCGKLLRPMLLLLCARTSDGFEANRERLITAAALIELTHMASLIHDDIIDDAPLRRGRASVQSKYGKDMAVYAGDYLLSRVMRELVRPELIPIGGIFADGISSMCMGELGQYEAQYDLETTPERYFSNISGKTAALFSVACKIGAVLSDCDEKTAETFGVFGRELGMLFQLRDDLIDCVPSKNEKSKLGGTDFSNGVYTLPVLYSMERPEYSAELRTLAETDPADAGRLFEIISASGGLERTKNCMKSCAENARQALCGVKNTRELAVIPKYILEN